MLVVLCFIAEYSVFMDDNYEIDWATEGMPLEPNEYYFQGKIVFADRDPDESSIWNYERVLGAAVLRGEIDAKEAYAALALYEQWLDEGEPKS